MSTIIKLRKECKSLIKKKRWKSALELIQSKKLSGLTITKSTIKSKYGLKPKQIEMLSFVEVDNPYYKCAAPMKLYLIGEVEYRFIKPSQNTGITHKQGLKEK